MKSNALNLLLLVGLLLAGCSPEKPAEAVADAQPKHYTLRGEILSVDLVQHVLVVI